MKTDTQKERIIGLELIKILACLGVVALHTLRPGKGPINHALTLSASLSVPLFFIVSGYLMFRKDSLNYRYVLKKILRILIVCLCWEALHAAAYWIYYRQSRNFLESFLLDFFQRGLFYHFWYMGALVLVYTVMPILFRLYKQSPKWYNLLLLALFGINLIITSAQIIMKDTFILQIPQNLRIWIWLLYAMVGGKMSGMADSCLSKIRPYIPLLACSCLILMVPYLTIVGKSAFGGIAIEAMYGSLFVQLAAVLLFSWLHRFTFCSKISSWLLSFSGLTMGIYIVHPFLLAVLKKFIPVFVDGSAWMNLLFWVTTLLLSALVADIIRKIPVLKQLIRL